MDQRSLPGADARVAGSLGREACARTIRESRLRTLIPGIEIESTSLVFQFLMFSVAYGPDSFQLPIVSFGCGAGLRRYPRTHAVGSFAQGRQGSAAKIVIDQRGGKRVARSHGIRNTNFAARVIADLFLRYQQTSLLAACHAHQLQLVGVANPPSRA